MTALDYTEATATRLPGAPYSGTERRAHPRAGSLHDLHVLMAARAYRMGDRELLRANLAAAEETRPDPAPPSRPHAPRWSGSQRRCRSCGCTDVNPCHTASGPCRWVSLDLCSACVGGEAA